MYYVRTLQHGQYTDVYKSLFVLNSNCPNKSAIKSFSNMVNVIQKYIYIDYILFPHNVLYLLFPKWRLQN